MKRVFACGVLNYWKAKSINHAGGDERTKFAGRENKEECFYPPPPPAPLTKRTLKRELCRVLEKAKMYSDDET